MPLVSTSHKPSQPKQTISLRKYTIYYAQMCYEVEIIAQNNEKLQCFSALQRWKRNEVSPHNLL